ncbi:MAG TPA: hypothetical protein VFD63_25935 [Pyrinomonadaceae bacterium]|nr:hypothetical protein [Pyrinomonadaceae bacterium]
MSEAIGKVSNRDVAVNRMLKAAPWLAVLVTTLPAPLVFLLLFLTSTATDSAAVLLLLAGTSLTFGFAIGLLIAVIFLFYRRKWLARLRDRLASDGITASEVVWFRSELTSAERASLSEIERSNPLLADAYLETLASRLTASRIISRSRNEMLKVERRLNRARSLASADTQALQKELLEDRDRLAAVRQRANDHLTKARARLQEIEATASRKLSVAETDVMMQRLGSAQDQLPLVLEIARLEQQALVEANTQLNDTPVKASGN